MTVMILYVPCKDVTEAKRISEGLIAKKLIACANLLPITSLYEWEGKMVDGSEVIMIAKTIPAKEEAARSFIGKNHSYDTPAILSFQASANKRYEDWMEEATR